MQLVVSLLSILFLVMACTPADSSDPNPDRGSTFTASTPRPTPTATPSVTPTPTVVPQSPPIPPPHPTPIPKPPEKSGIQGLWGGEHINISVNSRGAKIEVDCGYGEIDDSITPDSMGRFHVTGRIFKMMEPPANYSGAIPAIFDGVVEGRKMNLEIIWVEEGQSFDFEFELTRGHKGFVFNCI